MRIKLFIPALTLSLSLLSIPANALDITTAEGGTLASLIGDNTTISDLKVIGPVNALDFDYINESLPSLTSLNLSQATVTAVSGTKTQSGNTEFNANEIPQFALFGSKITSVTLPETVVKINESAFGNSAIKSITIPASVTAIGNYAFADCNGLTEVTVPSTVTDLGDGVWKNCSSLEKATIYSRVETIGADMFNGCKKLTEVTLQPGVRSIGDSSFANCTSLTSFTFPSSLVSIGDEAFYNSGLAAVSLADCGSLASIGDYSFAKCAALATVKMGSSSVALGKGLFFDDTALKSVVLPASTTAIPAFTFKGTNAIDAKTAVPDKVTDIDDYALYGWDSAEEFVLPANTAHLGTGAMEGWSSLKKLDAAQLTSVPALGEDVWAEVDQPKVTLLVKNDITEKAFKDADQWNNFNIKIGTTASDEILNDVTGNGNRGNVDFNVGDGYLNIKSQGAPIAHVSIFDLTGRNRYAATADAAELTLNTSQWRNSVLIVDVTLSDNSRATIKLSL